MLRKLTALSVALVMLTAGAASAATNPKRTSHGKSGQVLTASQATNLKPAGQWITVWGNHYNETIGIYVTYCKVVPAGELPTPCGAGIDLTGSTHTSVWVSSNPPFIAKPLVTPYKPGGRFKVKLWVKRKVGDLDCSKYKCAIATRSDHLNTDSRKNDVFIPITFTTKKGNK